jgi:hypothetical protein
MSALSISVRSLPLLMGKWALRTPMLDSGASLPSRTQLGGLAWPHPPTTTIRTTMGEGWR